MIKLICLSLFATLLHTAYGQFSFGNSEGSGYPRIKLGGPLGQLIGGGSSGLNLNSGLGQVLSTIMNSAVGAASQSNNGGGSPLTQLATAASTNYINALRSSLPFSQFLSNGNGGGQSQGQGSYGAASHQIYNTIPGPMNMLQQDPSMYAGQGFDASQFNPAMLQQFQQESK